MFFLFTGKYLSFQKVTHKENCLSGQYLLKFGGLNHQNPIYNTIVNILLENPTLKWLSRWVSKLARLLQKEPLSPFIIVKSRDAIQFCHKNRIFSLKRSPKSILFPTMRVSSSATLDGKGEYVSGHYLLKLGGCLTANLPIYNNLIISSTIMNILLETTSETSF